MIEVDTPDGVAEFPDGTSRETITAALQKRYGTPSASDAREKHGAGIAGIGGLLQGLTFGFGDEALGVVKALELGIRGDNRPFADRYADGVEQFRQLNRELRKDAPVSNVAGELAGGIASSVALPVGKVAQGAGIGAKTVAGAQAGAVGGGLYGAGDADGDLADRVQGAVTGAAIGGGLGAAVPGVVDGARALVRGAGTPVQRALNPRRAAGQLVNTALKRDLGTVDRAAARLSQAQNVAPDTILADVAGKNTQNLLRAATNVPSAAREKLVRTVERRQVRQVDNLQDAITDAVGDGKKFFATVDDLLATRSAKAKPAFAKAFARPTPYTAELEDVLNRPLTQQLVRKAAVDAANRGEQFSQFFINVGDDAIRIERVPDTQALHRIKMTIDSAIEASRRGQESSLKNADFRTLTILKRDLMGAISNPDYKAALRQFAGSSSLKGALEDGREAFKKMQPEEIIKAIRQLKSNNERDMFRLGVARAIFETLQRGNIGRNRVEVLRSPAVMSKLKAIFPNAKARSRFMQALAVEGRKSRTRTAVKGNSTSAAQLAEGLEAGIDPDNISQGAQAVAGLARGDVLGVALQAATRAKNLASGITPRVAEELIDLITSPDVSAVQKQVADAVISQLSAEQRAAITQMALSRVVGGQAGSTAGNNLGEQ